MCVSLGARLTRTRQCVNVRRTQSTLKTRLVASREIAHEKHEIGDVGMYVEEDEAWLRERDAVQ